MATTTNASPPLATAARLGSDHLPSIVEGTSDAVLTWTEDGDLLYANAAARHVMGAVDAAGDALPSELNALSGWAAEMLREEAMTAAARAGVWEGELALERHDGEEVPVSVVLVAHDPGADGRRLYSACCRDLTERLAAEQDAARRTMYDAPTGLPGRALFLELAASGLRAGERGRRSVALFVVGIDRTEAIAQSLGHHALDVLAAAAADRLHGEVRASEGLASMGEGAFAVLCKDTASGAAWGIAERLREALSRPFLIEGRTLSVSASVGFVCALGDALESPEGLLRDASGARRVAQERGGDGIEQFHRAKRARTVERLDIESGLRRALERDELVLHYQPEVNMLTGAIEGFEALLRWRHPVRGLVPPGAFIGVAEETGLIVPLGAWVMEEACRQSAAWSIAHPGAPLFVSVNASPRQFSRPDFLTCTRRALDASGADPACVVVEVTEGVVAERTATVQRGFDGLREMGLRLAIDDFGSGYSSLGYLRRFAADLLKLDRSFVREIEHNQDDWEIVNAVISLAHAMRLRVVAEGVETSEQAGTLRILGADIAQGYYYARPLPVHEADALLQEGVPWLPAARPSG